MKVKYWAEYFFLQINVSFQRSKNEALLDTREIWHGIRLILRISNNWKSGSMLVGRIELKNVLRDDEQQNDNSMIDLHKIVKIRENIVSCSTILHVHAICQSFACNENFHLGKSNNLNK